MRGLAYRIHEGKFKNPLSQGKARNLICPCGSSLKAKKCCGKNVVVVDKRMYDKLTRYIEGALKMDQKTLKQYMEKQLKEMTSNIGATDDEAKTQLEKVLQENSEQR